MPDIAMVVIRGGITFVVLLTMTRIMGKRQLSEITVFDYVVGITIGSMAATGTVELENAPLAAVIGMLIWTVLPVGVALLSIKSTAFHNLVHGKPTNIIEDGKVLEKNLKKEILSTDDVMMMLRLKEAFSLSDIEDAVLETNGKISVLKHGEQQPVTAGQMGMPAAGHEKPVVVIKDGSVNRKTLKSLGYDLRDLDNLLLEQGIDDARDVMLAQLDSGGSLYIDLYDDWRVEPHRPHTAKLLHANLLKFEAQMETFALDTDDQQAAKLYGDLAEQAQKVVEGLGGYLQR